VKSRSFSEKDIIAKVTFDNQPSRANVQKRAFKDKIDAFVKSVGGSAYTDITGGLIQGAMFLNETGAGTKTILIFSDMQEELDKVTVREFPINLKDIRVVALNVVKLKTDNIDPRRYMGASRPGRSGSWRPARRSGASSTTSSASTRSWEGASGPATQRFSDARYFLNCALAFSKALRIAAQASSAPRVSSIQASPEAACTLRSCSFAWS